MKGGATRIENGFQRKWFGKKRLELKPVYGNPNTKVSKSWGIYNLVWIKLGIYNMITQAHSVNLNPKQILSG